MSTAKLLDGDLRILIMLIKIENTRFDKFFDSRISNMKARKMKFLLNFYFLYDKIS